MHIRSWECDFSIMHVLNTLLLLSLTTGVSECVIVVEVRANELVKSIDKVKVVDVRDQLSRETDGFIHDSQLREALKANNELAFSALNKSNDVVVVANDKSFVDVIEKRADVNDHNELLIYKEGMKAFSEAGGRVDFPKFIHFEALQKLLSTSSVLLLDVRNRTELITRGQIPESVCVPLHELRVAFDESKLSSAEFERRFNFVRPASERRDIVLTCRSGRRVLVADRILREKFAFNDLRIYSGSFRDWKRRGGKVVKGDFQSDYQTLN